MIDSRFVIVSSISNCLEKNGVVTFMAILRSNAQAFQEQNLQLSFANFVDFPESTAANQSQQQKGQEASPKNRFIAPLKRLVKAYLVERAFTAFLLMAATVLRRALVATWKAKRLERSDCIHFYQDVLCAYFGQKLHRGQARKALLLHSGNDSLHQFFTHFHGMRGTWYEAAIRRRFGGVLRSMDAIITLNESYASALRAQHPGVDIRCIYNTSPFVKAGPAVRGAASASNKLHILAVGSLQYIKGFDLLIKGVSKMREMDRSRLHVTIVGGGAEEASLQSTIRDLDLENVVTLNGESSDVAPFLARADAFILTSRDEGFPIALIEASSVGLPIISTRVGAIPEVFDEMSCLFIDANAESICGVLTAASRGEINMQVMSYRSKAVFESKLSLQSFLTAYLNLFNDLSKRDAV